MWDSLHLKLERVLDDRGSRASVATPAAVEQRKAGSLYFYQE
jgi:hypothetical protein